MKPTKKLGGLLLILVMCGLTIALVSWSGDRDSTGSGTQTDTIPRRLNEPRNLDDVLNELESLDIEKTLKDAQLQVEKAMKGVDFDKLKLQIESAMKEVDFDKIERELKESLAKIDMDKMKLEFEGAMKEVDFEKIREEIKASLKEIDLDKMKLEFQKVKEIDLKEMEEELAKVKEELSRMGPELEKELSKAREELEKAKVEIREYKSFVDGLESDGLISKKDGFTLEHKDGELLINGKKASSQTYNKYRSFLEKHKKFRLVQDDSKFDLDDE